MSMEASTAAPPTTTGSSTPSNPTPSGMQQGNSSPNEATGASQGGNQGNPSTNISKKLGDEANSPSPSPSPEHYELKINGKTLKMNLEELKAHAQRSYAAQAKFEEASRLKKEAEQFRETLKKNKIQALMDPSLGFTKEQIRDEFERWYSQEFIEPEQMNPDQRRAREYELKLKQYEEREKQQKEQQEQEQLKSMTEKQKEYFVNQITQAMDQSKLPKSAFLAQRMAFYMRQNLANGWEAPMELIIQQVKDERSQLMSDITENADVPSLIEMLGENLINKIRKYDLEQLRSKRNFPPVQNPIQDSGADGYGNKERLSSRDVQKRLNEMRLGKR